MVEIVKKFNMDYSKKDGKNFEIRMRINNNRFQKQFEKAQYILDNSIMNSMIPFMPMDDGTFINITRGMSQAIAGSGEVVAGAPPFGRYLYNGKVMVDEQTRSPWARKGAKKVVIDKELNYLKVRNPDAQAFWFDAAKKKDLEEWLAIAKENAGGGIK